MELPAGFTQALAKKPICGVLAVAICAGVDYDTANAAIRRAMLPHQKRHGGKTYHRQQCNALWALGVKFKERTFVCGGGTVRNFIEGQAERDVTYLIGVSGHVFTLRNNAIADQAGVWNYLLSKQANRRIKKIVEIIV